jgi:membrane-bound PQQ-dependent dehydrogenase (glucose/quinate/shikimate family)
MAARVAQWIFAAFLALVGVYLAWLGIKLISLGGSPYYAPVGVGLILVAALAAIGNVWGPRLYAAIVAITVVWSLFEVGFDLIQLLPRLAAFLVVGLWFLSPWSRAAMRKGEGAQPGPNMGSGRWVGGAIAAGALALVVASFQGYHVQEGTKNAVASNVQPVTDWRNYGGTTLGTRFGQIDQINEKTVSGLKEVWRYRTGVSYDFKDTPQEANGLVYVCTAGNQVIALDGDTGVEKWRYNPKSKVPGARDATLAGASTFARTCRGLGYHEAAAGYTGECAKRVITNTTDMRLIALDAITGAPCRSFGHDGEVYLGSGLSKYGAPPTGETMTTSAPLIAGDIIVIGGWVTDNQMLGNVSGVVRAYNAETGAFAWAWDLGNPGYHGLPDEGGEYTRGTPNSWTNMSYDPQLNLVYAATGNSSPDYFDGNLRTELAEQYASSVVAIDGATGEPKWHFQTVHRDIWDYDVPSQPVLVNVKKDGQDIPSVAVPTKRGEIFLLDRRDGTPVYPIEERPVPQNPAEGERTAPTQPFSPLPNFRADRNESNMWGLTPLDQLYCRVQFKKLRYDGHFTPPMRGGGGGDTGKPAYGGTFQYPGNAGGFNWGSVSVDADNGLLVAAPMLMGNRIVLRTQDEVRADRLAAAQRRQAQTRDEHAGPTPQGAPAAAGGRAGPGGPAAAPGTTPPGPQAQARPPGGMGGGGPRPKDPQYDAKNVTYVGQTAPFMSEWKIPLTNIGTEVPCFAPPWGVMGVIDLNTNKLLWKHPIGSMKDSGPFGISSGLPFIVGTPVQGGTLTTRGGLIFQGGAMDSTMRAYGLRDGKVKWQAPLPGSAHATPMTYLSPTTGKQYVVITVPNPNWKYPRTSNEKPSDDKGGWVIGYALKDAPAK